MDLSNIRLRGGVREHDRANVQYLAPAQENIVVVDSTSASYSTEEQDVFLAKGFGEGGCSRLFEECVQITTIFGGRRSSNR